MTRIQSPQIVTDVYHDLRDRKLLPLVAVLLAGMAIVPIALSSSAETPPAPPPPSAQVAADPNAPDEEVTVADPGLRNYKRRLDGDAPKDPFVQQFAAPQDSSAGLTVASSSAAPSGGASSGTAAPSGDTAGTTGGGSAAPQPAAQPQPVQPQTESKYYSYRVKVRTGQLGQELKVKESVGGFTQLPSNQVPALTFLGVDTDSSFKPKSAVFLVSNLVTSVSGEGRCTLSGTQCQLLFLKPGEYEDVVYSDGLTYRINLVKYDLVARLPGVDKGGSDKGKNKQRRGRG